MPDSSTSRADQARPLPEGEPPIDGADDAGLTGTTEAGTTGVRATDPAEPEAAAEPDGDDPDGDEPAGFENRAARRAKGKGATAQQRAQDTTRKFGGRGSVQGPRQWGNRRTG